MWDVMPFCLHWLVALSTHRSAAVIREPCTPAGRSVSRLAVQRKESAARAENRKSYVILQPVEWAPSARGNRTLQYRVTTTVENVARHMSLGVAPVPSTLFQVFISSRLKQGFSSRVAVNNCADVAQPKISSKRIVPSCVICRVGLKGQCKGLGRDGVGGGGKGRIPLECLVTAKTIPGQGGSYFVAVASAEPDSRADWRRMNDKFLVRMDQLKSSI